MDLIAREASIARDEGRYDDAMNILRGLFEQVDSGALPLRLNHFITMFEWSLLLPEYPPAREAFARMRDEQVRLLQLNDAHFGDLSQGRHYSRFQVIVDMNRMLNDSQSTYACFVHLVSAVPSQARCEAHLALPAVVEAGDFLLAEKYLGEPLARLVEINGLSRELPLYAPAGAPPRLGAELSNFMQAVELLHLVLKGTGRDSEAELLREAALAGLATEEMRELAAAEIAAPGTIIRRLSSHD